MIGIGEPHFRPCLRLYLVTIKNAVGSRKDLGKNDSIKIFWLENGEQSTLSLRAPNKILIVLTSPTKLFGRFKSNFLSVCEEKIIKRH